MDTYIVNIKGVTVWWCLYVLRNTLSIIWSSIHEKVEAELNKSVAYKKACISQRICTCSNSDVETLEKDVKYVQS